ncbi:ABC transporter ATP-binding protein [Sporichthya sp.]|uniref:ABC transporter ATP-binding protein n=1 Tax=Sporichthya sp. TaxID=65475 RepID=UPI0017F7FA4B|nr:ABC transporter ATP-binding protein [Sporichthya sp.]MBA3745547.1 ABC transporter ATP-binding protein [Sporichthya sp.]
MTALVEVRDLQVAFGRVRAVDGVDLTVTAGAAVGLLGRNGAGKSTTLRVMAGALPAAGGRVSIGGIDVADDPFAARAMVGYCPDVGGLIPRATPWEHLELAARLRRLPDGWQDRARDLLERFDLGGEADRVTAGFSHGMSRRMSVILAAFHGPAVLLLDEPFDGVDPLGVDATLDLVAEAQVAGAAVVISSHLLPLVVRATGQVVVLRQGRVVGAAPSAELGGDVGSDRYRALLAGARS